MLRKRSTGQWKSVHTSSARTEAVALTAAYPDLFDVKCLDCDVRDEAAQFCPAHVFDADTKARLADRASPAPRNGDVG